MASTGDRIRLALRRKGWTAADLARATERPESQISLILTGKRPGRNLLPDIARLLDVQLEWLTVGDPTRAPAWAVVNWEEMADFLQRGEFEKAAALADHAEAYGTDLPPAVKVLIARLEDDLEQWRKRAEQLQAEVDKLTEQIKDLAKEGGHAAPGKKRRR